MEKCRKCGMPLDDDSKCKCDSDLCKHCCDCGAKCQCECESC